MNILGVNVVLRVLRDIVVDGLQLVKDILDSLHEDRLQAPRQRIRIIWVILLERRSRLRFRYARNAAISSKFPNPLIRYVRRFRKYKPLQVRSTLCDQSAQHLGRTILVRAAFVSIHTGFFFNF